MLSKKIVMLLAAAALPNSLLPQEGEVYALGGTLVAVGVVIAAYKLYQQHMNTKTNRIILQQQDHTLTHLRKKITDPNLMQHNEKFLKLVDLIQEEEEYMQKIEKRDPNFFNSYSYIAANRLVLRYLPKLLLLRHQFMQEEETPEKVLVHFRTECLEAAWKIGLWTDKLFFIRALHNSNISKEEEKYINGLAIETQYVGFHLRDSIELRKKMIISDKILSL